MCCREAMSSGLRAVSRFFNLIIIVTQYGKSIPSPNIARSYKLTTFFIIISAPLRLCGYYFQNGMQIIH